MFKCDKNTYLIGTIASLVVVVIVLTVLMFRMNSQLNVLASEESSQSRFKVGSPEPDIELLDPDDDWSIVNDPFDMNNWDPFKEMEQMQRRIDQMFGNAFGRFGQSSQFGSLFRDSAFSPDFDMREEGSRYIVQVDIPGADENEINVEVDGINLTVEAISKQGLTKQNQSGTTLHQERRVGSFKRSVQLPELVDANTLETHYKDGVLTITLEKASGIASEGQPET